MALDYLRAPRDVDAQYDAWGANCGPAALAAALGLDVVDVRDAVSPFRGYMGVRDMVRALEHLQVKSARVTMATLDKVPPIPHSMILVLLLWSGPWDAVPRAAAAHRHWIVRRPDELYDVNCGWTSLAAWDSETKPELIPPRGNGSYKIAMAAALQSFRGHALH